MTRGELAEQNFRNGCNCAQAVLLAFAEEAGLDEETAMRISAPFGGGIGRMREVCGAVSGMLMAFGLLRCGGDVPSQAEKARQYAQVRELADRFRAKNGSILCRELLGGVAAAGGAPEPRTPEFYEKRPCAALCADAAELLARYLEESGWKKF